MKNSKTIRVRVILKSTSLERLPLHENGLSVERHSWFGNDSYLSREQRKRAVISLSAPKVENLQQPRRNTPINTPGVWFWLQTKSVLTQERAGWPAFRSQIDNEQGRGSYLTSTALLYSLIRFLSASVFMVQKQCSGDFRFKIFLYCS